MCDILPYKNQDYEKLKSQHNAQKLFVDPEFPATHKSIYHSGKNVKDVQWIRPTVRISGKQVHVVLAVSLFDRPFFKSPNSLSMDFNGVIWIKARSV